MACRSLDSFLIAIVVSALVTGCGDSQATSTTADAGTDAARIVPAYGFGTEDSGVIIGSGTGGTTSGDDSGTSSGPASVVINEVDYEEPGTDDSEFVELYNPSTTASIDVSNMALTFVNSSSEYLRVNLTGTIGPQGYLVVADTKVTVGGTAAVIRFTKASDNLRNGPDAVAIIDRTTANVIDALSYGGEISGYVEGTATDAVDSSSTAGSLVRIPNGSDTNDAATDWAFTTTISPGTANTKT